MAKYSVNSTEIIDDSGLIDWNKIKNAPSAATVSGTNLGTITNCGTGMAINVSRTSASNGRISFAFTSVNTGTQTNCNCNCDNSFNCNC